MRARGGRSRRAGAAGASRARTGARRAPPAPRAPTGAREEARALEAPRRAARPGLGRAPGGGEARSGEVGPSLGAGRGPGGSLRAVGWGPVLHRTPTWGPGGPSGTPGACEGAAGCCAAPWGPFRNDRPRQPWAPRPPAARRPLSPRRRPGECALGRRLGVPAEFGAAGSSFQGAGGACACPARLGAAPAASQMDSAGPPEGWRSSRTWDPGWGLGVSCGRSGKTGLRVHGRPAFLLHPRTPGAPLPGLPLLGVGLSCHRRALSPPEPRPPGSLLPRLNVPGISMGRTRRLTVGLKPSGAQSKPTLSSCPGSLREGVTVAHTLNKERFLKNSTILRFAKPYNPFAPPPHCCCSRKRKTTELRDQKPHFHSNLKARFPRMYPLRTRSSPKRARSVCSHLSTGLRAY